MNINNKLQAASHSGAKLTVFKKGEEFIVEKKIFSSIERNKLAIKKQQEFKKIVTESYDLQAIPVKSLKENSEELIIEMPYVEGIGGDQLSVKGNKIMARNLCISLNSYLINTLAKSTTQVIHKEVVLEKVINIEKQMQSLFGLNPEVQAVILLVKNICAEDFSMPIGPCHGDLTLANIKITQENQLYLFDFLDSFIETPLQDAAKLLQDIDYGWSLRKEKSSVRLKGTLFYEKAYPTFVDTLIFMYPREMKMLEIMTLLRIAPYIDLNDKITINWFNLSMVKVLKKFGD